MYSHNKTVAKEFLLQEDEEKLMIYSKLEDLDVYPKSLSWWNFIIPYEQSLESYQEMKHFISAHSFKSFYYVDYTKYETLIQNEKK